MLLSIVNEAKYEVLTCLTWLNFIKTLKIWIKLFNRNSKCRSHYSNMQNKQQEQHLPIQQSQLADKK